MVSARSLRSALTREELTERLHWALAPSRFVATWPLLDSVEGFLSKREAELLYSLALTVPAGRSIVEIGSYKGRSTCVLAAAAQGRVPVYAVDPHTGDRTEVENGEVVDTWEEFTANLRRTSARSVIAVRQKSVEAAARYDGPPLGLLFVDGWHSTEAVIADVESWRPYAVEDCLYVFDDWEHPEVAAGIATMTHRLPPRRGAAGKDAVYARRLPLRVRRLLR